MDAQNRKIYLVISGALIVLFILILVVPFSKKNPSKNDNTDTINQPFPTSVEINSSTSVNNEPTPQPIQADFTGTVDEPIPQEIVDSSTQKKDLQSKVPLDFSIFSIDFDYGEDKFIITLKDPKDQAREEFESWRSTNYPALSASQFLLK